MFCILIVSLLSHLKVMFLTLFIFIFIIKYAKGCLSLRISLGPSLHALAHKHDVSSILFMKKVSIGNYGVTHHSHYPNTWHEVRLCFDPWYTPWSLCKVKFKCLIYMLNKVGTYGVHTIVEGWSMAIPTLRCIKHKVLLCDNMGGTRLWFDVLWFDFHIKYWSWLRVDSATRKLISMREFKS